ncbi:MAG: filamentous hemagglutinin N-terminal domain-containing protein, partial [Candidatus Omnitrophica bacterium]|nr:filamentous hemagglutinin N-terminal domain-containing protein [Candidatus Omnitrophota bacterium]
MVNLIIRRISALLILTGLILNAGYALALPEGEEVVSGSAEFSRPDDNTVNITTSDKAIINYETFNIAQPETVRFIQPSSSSSALNRVVGINPSEIFGSIQSNGKIFLVNPNGIFFGPSSRVDTGSFLASTLDIKNEDFQNNKL